MALGPDRWRLYGLALGEVGRLSRAPLGRFGRRPRLGAPVPRRLLFAPHDLRTADSSIAADIYAGSFVFAGRALATGGRSPFAFDPPSRAWGEALYGFGWLRHLRAADTALARANARALVDEFITRAPGTRLAGQTHVAARRLTSFLSQSPLLLDGADHAFYGRFLRALGRTVARLDRDLANPATLPQRRLSAAIALSTAGLCCEGFERLSRRAARSLTRELEAQILPDGGHVSRHPGVLVNLLLDLLPLRQVYASRGAEPPTALIGAIDRMLPMLRLFRHPDGSLSHFNGMGVAAADHLATLLIYDAGRARPMSHAPHSGYERLEANGLLMVADVGPPPPPLHAAEAHAGCLSFELSSGRQRIVVNCGAPRSVADAAVQAARATVAHATATVAETSSARFLPARGLVGRWLARRLGGAVILSGPFAVTSERGAERADGAMTLAARHDGYRARFGLTHERRWRLDPAGDALEGEDAFAHEPGTAAASAAVAVRFHLAPGVRASRVGGEGLILLVLPNQETWRFEATSHDPILEESVFFAATDGARRTEQIVIHLDAAEASSVRWRFERVTTGAERRS